MGKSRKTEQNQSCCHLELKPDQVVSNRYIIEKTLGHGGIGVVYLTHDRQSNDELKALKLIRENYLNLNTSINFSKEFQLLHQLRHPGIVYCHEYGRCDNVGEYFTMEYIHWRTLDEVSQKLTMDMSLRVLYDLADVLTFIHNHQIAHYDLKPNNIFIDIDTLLKQKPSGLPVVKICDFGLADRKNSQNITERQGSFTYSAPEMFLPGKIDPRVDFFAFGMIGYTLLTQKLPYSTESKFPLLQQKQQWLPDPDAWDNAGVPPALSALLTRCLNPNPAVRPRNGSEILSELARLSPVKNRNIECLMYAPFIGRSSELRHLGSTIYEVVNGEQWAFLIYGDSEIGKSRLIEEFGLRTQLKGIDVVYIEGNDLRPLLNYFNTENTNTIFEETKSKYDNIIRQISYQFEEGRKIKPLVICWQRFNNANIDLIRAFKENLLNHPNIPILWLLESKNDHNELSSLFYSDHLTRCHLKELKIEEVEKLIGKVLGFAYNHELLSKNLYSYAGGKPGWLMYIIRQLINKQKIIYRNGNWSIIETNVVGSSQDVKELLETDLSKLSSTSRWVIEWLAVLNKEVDIDVIRKALELQLNIWTNVIHELSTIGLIEVVGSRVRFPLPVLRESIYNSIPVPNRRQLHLLVGRWLEENDTSEGNLEILISITQHYHNAHEPRSFLRVIEKVLDIIKNTKIIVFEPEILEAALDTQEYSLSQLNKYRCYELLAKAYERNKRYRDSVKIYQLLLSDTSLNIYSQIGIIHLQLGKCLFFTQEYEGAKYHLEEAVDLLENENTEAAAQAMRRLAYFLHQRGEINESLRITIKYRNWTDKISNRKSRFPHLVGCAKLFTLNKKLDEAQQCYKEIIDESENPWETNTTIWAYRELIQIYIIHLGEWERALNTLDFLEKNKPFTYERKDNWYSSYLRAMALISSGQIDEGMDIFEKIECNIKVNADPIHHCRILFDLIRIDYFRGRYWQGMQRIRQSMGIAQRLGLKHLQAVILALAVKFRDMSGKSSDKLAKSTIKLITILKHPLSNCMASYFLYQHFLEEDNYSSALRMVSLAKENIKVSDFIIPLPLIELIAHRIEKYSKSQKTEYQKWDILSKQIIQKIDRGDYYYELLKLSIKDEDIKRSKIYFQKASSCFNELNAGLMIARCKELYGTACAKWKLTEEAKRLLDQSEKIYRSLGLHYDIHRTISSQSSLEGEDLVNTEKVLPVRELSEVIELLNSLEDPDKLTSRLLNMAVKGVGAKRGLIIFRRQKTHNLSSRATIQVGPKEADAISHTIAKQVFKDKTSVFSDNALDDNYLSSLESVKLHKIHAVACLPIISKGETAGVLYLDHKGSTGTFSEDDQNYLKLFANLIGTVLTHNHFIEVLKDNVKTLHRNATQIEGYDEFIGRSKSVIEVFHILNLLREHDLPVLILGESGTGKELISKIIHRQSKRSIFLRESLNCSGIADSMLESELFGHKKGAFTDAKEDKDGLFKIANGGTIFLDEMDLMSQAMQKKLLRVLQEGEYRPVGDNEVYKTDVRIIAAAKESLPEEVEKGNFREDLFYRINVVQIKLPPLRERIEDIPLLVNNFINKYNREFNRHIKGIGYEALSVLQKYIYPGNVRQLENAIRRTYVFVNDNELIHVEHLPDEILECDTDLLLQRKSLKRIVKDNENKIILKVLNESNWNKSEAARRLKVTSSYLFRRIRKYNLKPE
ncbi:sigma 54-interacting transcriptional regulator [bacterium]|nr:sigma 54-interacting transcriptional regulator [bacterium]